MYIQVHQIYRIILNAVFLGNTLRFVSREGKLKRVLLKNNLYYQRHKKTTCLCFYVFDIIYALVI